MKNLFKILIPSIFLFFLIDESTSKDSFSQITPTFPNIIHCTPYAYGDFNADKLIDIFCLKNTSKSDNI